MGAVQGGRQTSLTIQPEAGMWQRREQRLVEAFVAQATVKALDEWLISFWEAVGSDHEIGRSQGLHPSHAVGAPFSRDPGAS